MKLVAERPYADPEVAARKLVELAAGIEAVQDGRIHVEKINAPFLFTLRGSGPEFGRHQARDRPRLARVARKRDLCAAADNERGSAAGSIKQHHRHPRRQ